MVILLVKTLSIIFREIFIPWSGIEPGTFRSQADCANRYTTMLRYRQLLFSFEITLTKELVVSKILLTGWSQLGRYQYSPLPLVSWPAYGNQKYLSGRLFLNLVPFFQFSVKNLNEIDCTAKLVVPTVLQNQKYRWITVLENQKYRGITVLQTIRDR